ncbi:hypothetical protein JCM15786_10910 [Nautilia lithotrophica]
MRIKINNIKHSSQFSILNSQFDHVPCFILVGGKSSRFGSEKDDKAVLFYKLQYDKCKKIFKNVYFVAKYEKFKNYPFFIEKSKIYAPLPAIEEIVKKYKKIFILSVDTPNITQKSIIRLLQKKAVASDNPLIGYYDYTMLKKIRRNLKGKMRIYDINKIKININEKELLNINTLKDLNNL